MRNGVVGRIGSNIPMALSNTKNQPSNISNFFGIASTYLFPINCVQFGGSQIIMKMQKITTAIKNSMKFFCGYFPRFGGKGIPQ